jgi:hypothetical protein
VGLAVETLAFRVANPSSTFTAVTMATGDSSTVRQFNPATKAVLEHVTRQGATAGGFRILSPVFHDNVTGLTYIFNETPSVLFMPDYIGQPCQPGDLLTISGTGGTNETEVGSITLYYQDVLGMAATLYNWADISGAIEHVKPFEVDVSVGGTAGVWASAALNATDKQAKSDRKYAILGWTTDTALAAIAFKGGETGNLRCGGPASLSPEQMSHWFIQESIRMGTPHIPVISANNFPSTTCEIVTTATSGTAKIIVNTGLLRAGF